jgi:hypothetical protein
LQAVGLTAAVLLLTVRVLADSAAERPADKGPMIEQLKKDDPVRYARLMRDFAAFRALPPERQEALRKMQADLQADKSATHAQHIEAVLDRYSAWLDRLPEADRRNVLAAEDRPTRMKRIHELRVKEWLARLPKATAERFQKASAKERERIWQDYFDERAEWQIATRFSEDRPDRLGSLLSLSPQMPTRPEMMSEDARDFLEKKLRPLLSAEEEKALHDAEGKWPRYPHLFVELADAHPLSLLGPIGPTKISDLPTKVREHLEGKGPIAIQARKNLLAVEGKWPAFGSVLHEWHLRRDDLTDAGLAKKTIPSRPEDFAGTINRFIDDKLVPALDKDEAAQLGAALGKWPKYPEKVLELAQKHNLAIPPAPNGLPQREGWERYRVKRPAPLE